ncbi:MAG: fibronectin type III domain-containing protein [Terracidiphilus sp.]
MRPGHKLGWAALPAARSAVLSTILTIGFVLTGCGTPGAPMPPSLNLPDPVTNLSATRAGNQVSLTWTMPRRNTDKLLLKGNLPVRVCHKEDENACAPVPANLLFAPGAAGSFTETLPPALAAGAPRKLACFVELPNRKGRSAGLSNAAVVLAGEAPAAVANLTAEVRKDGVALRWTPDSPSAPPFSQAAIRLHRTLLTPQPDAKPKSQQGILAPAPEPLEQSLLVDSDAAGRALDKDIRFGQTYEYRAQRVARITVGSQTLELAGPLSAPVRVEALDVFPPAVPTGLAAVATAPSAVSEAAIDLSWQPNTEADLTGYAVYRREGAESWQRISPAQPLVGPAFHDSRIQPGRTYRYAVTAIDQGGHESARSAEAEETAPNP